MKDFFIYILHNMRKYLRPSKWGKKNPVIEIPGWQTVTSVQLNITDQTGGEH